MVDKVDRKRVALLLAATLGLMAMGRGIRSRLSEADLTGQVALITGGSRGLGFLIARELARAGCRLAICARSEVALQDARSALEQEGAEVLAVPCDVSDRVSVERLIEAVRGRYGRIDLLVNNAGIIQVGPVRTMSLEDFEAAVGTMFWGTVYPTIAVLPEMLERRTGRIVNITSIGGKIAVPHLLPYTSAKFAAVGFSEGLRVELAREGISVTTIVPGLMRTGSHLNASFKGTPEREFTWFSLGASLPFVSMDAEKAARQIVLTARRGAAERTLSVPATALVAVQGLFPGMVSAALSLVNQFVLPSAKGQAGTDAVRGAVVEQRSPSMLRDGLTSWGRSAARRFHEQPAASDNGPWPADA